MYSPLHKKQILTLNNLSEFIKNNELTPNLNNMLEKNNILAVFNFFNQMKSEDFIEIKNNNKLIIKNPLLKKLLKSNIVINREEYIKTHIKYNNDYNNDDYYNQILENSSNKFGEYHKNVEIFIHNEKLMNAILQEPYHFIRNNLEDYEVGNFVEYGNYLFTKNAFSEEVNKSLIDYMKNYNVYINHPRVGKSILEKVAKDIVELEKPNFSSTVLLNFSNYSLEIISNINK